MIVQECEDPAQLGGQYKEWAKNYIWQGDNKNKGIGIFARSNISIKRLDWNGIFCLDIQGTSSPNLKWKSEELRQFIPFLVNDDFICLAVWTKGDSNQVFGYMGQFWKYLQIHKKELAKHNVIIAGDFNSNKIWDKSDRWWNHSDVINELYDIDIVSLYHTYHQEEQGRESKPTFFLHRNIKKPYHIDYIFVGKAFHSSTLDVGKPEDWLEYSDHMPIVMTS